MLGRPAEVSVADMGRSTGWKDRFLAGVVRNKLGLDLRSDKIEGGDRNSGILLQRER